MTPICVACRRFFRCTKNDRCVVVGGRLWAADEYTCPGCGAQLVTGYAARPLAESYQPHFAATCAAHGADLEVNE